MHGSYIGTWEQLGAIRNGIGIGGESPLLPSHQDVKRTFTSKLSFMHGVQQRGHPKVAFISAPLGLI
jgi:hypothetical protein